MISLSHEVTKLSSYRKLLNIIKYSAKHGGFGISKYLVITFIHATPFQGYYY